MSHKRNQGFRYRLVLTDEESQSEVEVWKFDAAELVPDPDTAHDSVHQPMTQIGADIREAVDINEDTQYNLARPARMEFRVKGISEAETHLLWCRMAKVLEDAGIPVEDGGTQYLDHVDIARVK